MVSSDMLIAQTKAWLANIVIEHSLCPFAKREFEADSIHYKVIETHELERQLEQIILQCIGMDKDTSRVTSLLIFPEGLVDFEDYLDLLDIANALLQDQGYEGIYQLASFHPDYIFADTSADDPSNYTNRSPYPIVHILREASVQAALETFSNPEGIPERNIRLTREMGLKSMKALLDACYQ